MPIQDVKEGAGVYDESDLNVLLADVMSRIDRNESVDMQQLITSHPKHARELSNFFSFSHELSDLMGSSISLKVEEPLDQAQRSTTSIDSQTVAMLSSMSGAAEPELRKIGKYEVLDLLGAGSFGRVYLGYDPLAKRKVAIKVPRSWAGVSDEQRNAFLHEAQSAAALRHEHIVTLLDVYQGLDVPIALIYEHIPGPSMQLVLKQKDFQRSEAIGWIADIAAALDYAHRKDVVHRDIKPSNILLTVCNGRLQPRIVDFGLALLHNEFWHKGDRSRVGAIRYMSPEQAKSNSHWATAQSDVFSLGVVLYEVLCGRSPWTGTSEKEMLREIEERDPAPPRVMDGTISPELERVCLKALAKSPSDRYTTAADMAHDLRAAIRNRNPRTLGLKTLVAGAAAIMLIGAVAISSMYNSNSVTEAGLLHSPVAPAIETIEPQEVQLELRFQPLGKPGKSLPLTEETNSVKQSDRLQINAQIPRRGYLYVVWYRPDGSIRLLDDKALATPSSAIQEPPVNEKTPWEPLSPGGAGKHVVIAFTKPTPLTSEDVDTLRHARRDTATDWLRGNTTFATGHPRITAGGAKRGGPQTIIQQPEIDADRYLGDLGAILKHKWNCYYQVIMFRVE